MNTLGSATRMEAIRADSAGPRGSDVGSRAMAAAVGAAASGGLAAVGVIVLALGARFGDALLFLGGYGVPIAALLGAVTAPGSIASLTPAWRALGLGIVAAELGSVELAAVWVIAPEALGTTPPSATVIGLQLTFGTVLSLIAVPVTAPVLWASVHLFRRLHRAGRRTAWYGVLVALGIEALIVGTHLASLGGA